MMLKQTVIAGLIAAATFSSAYAACDAAHGEKVFIKCKSCHTAEKGGPNRVGPNLFGVVGSKSASHAGYHYSPALQAANLTWDEATLDKWLEKPMALVHGTRMTFMGLPKPQDRADVICYLASQK